MVNNKIADSQGRSSKEVGTGRSKKVVICKFCGIDISLMGGAARERHDTGNCGTRKNTFVRAGHPRKGGFSRTKPAGRPPRIPEAVAPEVDDVDQAPEVAADVDQAPEVAADVDQAPKVGFDPEAVLP